MTSKSRHQEEADLATEQPKVVNATTPPTAAVVGGKKKHKRRRQALMPPPPEVLTLGDSLPGRLLNTLWHAKLGRARRDALLVELASQIPDERVEGPLDRLVEAYDLQFWFKHYARSRRVWAQLDGQMEHITLLGVDLADQQIKFLDAQLQERVLPVSEVKLVDEEERELRQQRTLLAKFDAKHTAIVEQLERVETQLTQATAARLGFIAAQIRGITSELKSLSNSRDALARRVSQLEVSAKERRHKATTILGEVSRGEIQRVNTV